MLDIVKPHSFKLQTQNVLLPTPFSILAPLISPQHAQFRALGALNLNVKIPGAHILTVVKNNIPLSKTTLAPIAKTFLTKPHNFMDSPTDGSA